MYVVLCAVLTVFVKKCARLIKFEAVSEWLSELLDHPTAGQRPESIRLQHRFLGLFAEFVSYANRDLNKVQHKLHQWKSTTFSSAQNAAGTFSETMRCRRPGNRSSNATWYTKLHRDLILSRVFEDT